MNQLIPTPAEWINYVSDYGNAKAERMNRFSGSFQPQKTPFPKAPDVQLPRTAAGISKSKWRLAGPGSHYKASAAVAYLMSDTGRNFQNCIDAWAGPAQ